VNFLLHTMCIIITGMNNQSALNKLKIHCILIYLIHSEYFQSLNCPVLDGVFFHDLRIGGKPKCAKVRFQDVVGGCCRVHARIFIVKPSRLTPHRFEDRRLARRWRSKKGKRILIKQTLFPTNNTVAPG